MTPVRPWLVVRMLAWRELVRFFRQRHRVIGAIGQPLLFWLLFGAGMRQSFRMTPDSEQTFLEYYFPGTVMLTLLFTAIFSTISIIEDRREGFLQSVLVGPAGRWSMVLGKLLGGSAIAMLQASFMLALGALIDAPSNWLDWGQMLGLLTLTAVGMTGLGFVLAWRLDSTQGFHAVMNLLLLSQSHRRCANAAAAVFVESPLHLPPPLLSSCCHCTAHTHTHTQIIQNLNNFILTYQFNLILILS